MARSNAVVSRPCSTTTVLATLELTSGDWSLDKEKKTDVGDLRNSDMNALFGLNELKEIRKKKLNDPTLMSPFFEMKKIKNRNLKNERKSLRNNPKFKMNVENAILSSNNNGTTSPSTSTSTSTSTPLIELPILTDQEKEIENKRKIHMKKELNKKLIRNTMLIREFKEAEILIAKDKDDKEKEKEILTAKEEMEIKEEIARDFLIHAEIEADLYNDSLKE